MPKIKKWIFVTGCPRSGTTYVGRMLARPLSVDYLHEPFNPDCGLPEITERYLYLKRGVVDEQGYRLAFQRFFDYKARLKTGIYPNDRLLVRVLKQIGGSRSGWSLRFARWNRFHNTAIVKDPIGCLLVEYLAKEFGFLPIVIVRHPVAVVSSLLRQPWSLKDHYRELCNSKGLKDTLFKSRPDLLNGAGDSLVEVAARLWSALNFAIIEQARLAPETTFYTYEEIVLDPLTLFEQMYLRAGLPWGVAVKSQILLASRRTPTSSIKESGNASVCFEVLSKADRATVFNITFPIAERWYSAHSYGAG